MGGAVGVGLRVGDEGMGIEGRLKRIGAGARGGNPEEEGLERRMTGDRPVWTLSETTTGTEGEGRGRGTSASRRRKRSGSELVAEERRGWEQRQQMPPLAFSTVPAFSGAEGVVGAAGHYRSLRGRRRG